MAIILGVGGSPRKGGNSDILIKRILKGARKKNTTTEEVQLRDYKFQPCKGCERCRKDEKCTGYKDGMQIIYPKITKAKGLILVSPIYNYNVTALMKSFIDRLYCFYDFSDKRPGDWSSQLANQDRKAIIAAIGEQSSYERGGMGLTLDTMRLNVEALGYELTAELPILGVFEKGKIVQYPKILEDAEGLGRQLASLVME